MVRSIVDLSLFPSFPDIDSVSDFFCEGCEGIGTEGGGGVPRVSQEVPRGLWGFP